MQIKIYEEFKFEKGKPNCYRFNRIVQQYCFFEENTEEEN